jgi:hypothetical protein
MFVLCDSMVLWTRHELTQGVYGRDRRVAAHAHRAITNIIPVQET